MRPLALLLVLAAPVVHAQADAEAVLAALAARRPDVSLVAYPVGAPEAGVFVNADRPRPLASTVKLLVLAEYARQVEEGRLDPAERVPRAALDAFYLPGSDGGAHEGAMAALGVAPADTLALDEVAWAMIRHSDNAATDYLLLRFGREAADAIPEHLGLRHADPPVPIGGLFLAWALPHEVGDETAIGADATTARAWALAARLRDDAGFRATAPQRLMAELADLGYDGQAAAAFSSPSGTAREYAGLMARLHEGTLLSEAASARMLALLDWPMDFPGNQARFDQLATKGGTLPGILTSAYLGDARGVAGADPPPTVLALFMEGLPAAVWGEWIQSYAHQAFEARLLEDPAFLEAVRERLGE